MSDQDKATNFFWAAVIVASMTATVVFGLTGEGDTAIAFSILAATGTYGYKNRV